MIMTEYEAIKKAYGEYWDIVKDRVKFNVKWGSGWLFYSDFEYKDKNVFYKIQEELGRESHPNNLGFRPKSLEGLETNNSWTKISSEVDLPLNKSIDIVINKEPFQGFVYKGQRGLFCCIENRYSSSSLEDEVVEASRITHYKIIEKPNLPIY